MFLMPTARPLGCQGTWGVLAVLGLMPGPALIIRIGFRTPLQYNYSITMMRNPQEDGFMNSDWQSPAL